MTVVVCEWDLLYNIIIMMKTLLKRGFTLMEILMTIAILAIFMVIAMPNFINVLENDSIVNMTNDVVFALKMARSEAIKRDVPVSVCATSDNTYTACGNNWNLGWMVFVNPTGGTTLSNTATAPLLRTEAITDQNATITSAPSVNIITYTGTGIAATNSGNVTFTIKATGCTGDSGRQVAISLSGNPVVTNVNCP